MDRLVMSDAVAQEEHALHPILDVGSNSPRVARARVLRKRRGDGRHPQRGQVRLRAEESPEPEIQLGDHSAVDFLILAPGSPPSGLDDVPDAISVPAQEELPSVVPQLWPFLRLPVGDESHVDRIAKDHFKAAEILMERGSDLRIPVVEPDRRLNVTVGVVQVRRQPVCREPLNDDLRIEP